MQRENGHESSASMMKGEQEDLSESGYEDEGPEEEKHDEQEESEQEEGQDGKDEQGTGQEVPADLKRVTMNPDEAETMSLEPFDPQLWRLDSKEDSQLLVRVDEKKDVSERNEEKDMPYVEDLVSDEDNEDMRGTFKDLGTGGYMHDTNIRTNTDMQFRSFLCLKKNVLCAHCDLYHVPKL